MPLSLVKGAKNLPALNMFTISQKFLLVMRWGYDRVYLQYSVMAAGANYKGPCTVLSASQFLNLLDIIIFPIFTDQEIEAPQP